MSDSKKKRLSMLDSLSAAGAPAPSPMLPRNRPLRAARDAVDSHSVWDLEPHQIIDTRVADRLDPGDVIDLRDSIEETGQTVPILVRRDPEDPDKYLLVYGRRRLEAIRSSDKVTKVRALIANMDANGAVEAQITENMARRDLSFIEKALFAHELIENGYGNQTRVAEVLTVTKSAISMALSVVETIGPDLIRSIGPAHGVGRPRWEALAKAIEPIDPNGLDLQQTADRIHAMAPVEALSGDPEALIDPSVKAFETVMEMVKPTAPPKPKPAKKSPAPQRFSVGTDTTTIRRTPDGVRVDVGQGAFADWVEAEGQNLIQDLHARWQQQQKTTK